MCVRANDTDSTATGLSNIPVVSKEVNPTALPERPFDIIIHMLLTSVAINLAVVEFTESGQNRKRLVRTAAILNIYIKLLCVKANPVAFVRKMHQTFTNAPL